MQFTHLLTCVFFVTAESKFFGLRAQRPLSGFLGDRADVPNLRISGEECADCIKNEPRIQIQKPEKIDAKRPEKVQHVPFPKKEKVAEPEVELKPLYGNSTPAEIIATKKDANSTVSEVKPKVDAKREGLKVNATKKEPVIDVPARKPRKTQTREEKLIDSLKGMEGDDAVGCVTHCRYGEFFRHTWKECLHKCVDNPAMRSIMESMLPEEDHEAVEKTVAVPTSLESHLDRHAKKLKERAEEL